MNRIDKRFKELKHARKKAFIAYITCGDPDMATTKAIVKELDNAGVDILELGVPFSDPMADGPTIQAASERALKKRVNLTGIIKFVKQLRRETDMPVALMTYYNPVFAYGVRRFVKAASAAGVDGVIIPDLPPEEAKDLIAAGGGKNFKHVFLLSPTSSPERVRIVGKKSSGFIYYISLTGVTGARRELPKEIAGNVKKIKRVTGKPVCVGFGVSTPKQAKRIAGIADGVIVGSAIIKVVEKNLGERKAIPKKVGAFVRPLVRAIK